MNIVNYQISPLDPHAHLFEVRCTVNVPDPEGQRFRLPAWIPGSYLIREFARQFVHVRAESGGGALPIVKETKDTWRTAPSTAPVTVIAEIYAYDVSVRTAYLDQSRAYFNGPCVFLRPDGYEEESCSVDIVRPARAEFANWRVATTLPPDGAATYGFGRYRASNYDELVDHPVEMGDFVLAAFGAGGARHEIAVSGHPHADVERLSRDLARLCQWHIDLFGGARQSAAPFDRYLFQITAVGEGHGGLEHRSSTSLLCRRDELPTRGRDAINDRYLNLLGLASHEYFHAWNVKRIKPVAFAPYDLMRENYTRQLWAFEGLTSYYDDLALVRCGLIDEHRYLELLGRTITNMLRTPGRHRQSIADSSFDAWIKFYRPDENSPNSVISYYTKGSVVALALDLLLRSSSTTSLDDIMRALWKRYGQPAIGVGEDDIARLVCELSGRDMHPFFDRYVNGTDDPPLDALLAAFGIDWHVRASTGADDGGGKPAANTPPACWLGARTSADLHLQHVFAGGPCERAGLAANDVLVAIDGVRASKASIDALLADRAPGERVSVHAFRRDALIQAELELQSAPLDVCYLTLRTDASDEATALRRAWLGA